MTTNKIISQIYPEHSDHSTRLNEQDTKVFEEKKANSHFGEIGISSMRDLFSSAKLDVAANDILLDFGSGQGKFAFQAFLEYPHLKTVVGVELSTQRFSSALRAAQLYHSQHRGDVQLEISDNRVQLVENKRQLIFLCTSIFEVKRWIPQTKVIHLNVDFYGVPQKDVDALLLSLLPGTRLSCYNALQCCSYPVRKAFKLLDGHVAYLQLYEKISIRKGKKTQRKNKSRRRKKARIQE